MLHWSVRRSGRLISMSTSEKLGAVDDDFRRSMNLVRALTVLQLWDERTFYESFITKKLLQTV